MLLLFSLPFQFSFELFWTVIGVFTAYRTVLTRYTYRTVLTRYTTVHCWHVIRTVHCWHVIRTVQCWHVIRTVHCWHVIRTVHCWHVIRTVHCWHVILPYIVDTPQCYGIRTVHCLSCCLLPSCSGSSAKDTFVCFPSICATNRRANKCCSEISVLLGCYAAEIGS